MLPAPLRSAAALLRAACPPDRPVRIRLVDLDDRWADCSRGARGYLIRLHRPSALAAPSLVVWLLAHEWAHALAWTADGDEAHGPGFGAAYARCARVLSLE